LSPAAVTFYGLTANACHLDLIPFATERKWTELTGSQRNALLDASGDTLGSLIQDSDIRVLILNGSAVIQTFERQSGIDLARQPMRSWALPRKSNADVTGIAYRGSTNRIGDVHLRRELLVLGFNHNIQSSFGVTTDVMGAIARWVSAHVR